MSLRSWLLSWRRQKRRQGPSRTAGAGRSPCVSQDQRRRGVGRPRAPTVLIMDGTLSHARRHRDGVGSGGKRAGDPEAEVVVPVVGVVPVADIGRPPNLGQEMIQGNRVKGGIWRSRQGSCPPCGGGWGVAPRSSRGIHNPWPQFLSLTRTVSR